MSTTNNNILDQSEPTTPINDNSGVVGNRGGDNFFRGQRTHNYNNQRSQQRNNQQQFNFGYNNKSQRRNNNNNYGNNNGRGQFRNYNYRGARRV
jgi:hypothetical protein